MTATMRQTPENPQQGIQKDHTSQSETSHLQMLYGAGQRIHPIFRTFLHEQQEQGQLLHARLPEFNVELQGFSLQWKEDDINKLVNAKVKTPDNYIPTAISLKGAAFRYSSEEHEDGSKTVYCFSKDTEPKDADITTGITDDTISQLRGALNMIYAEVAQVTENDLMLVSSEILPNESEMNATFLSIFDAGEQKS
jgi:hypothetical protein